MNEILRAHSNLSPCHLSTGAVHKVRHAIFGQFLPPPLSHFVTHPAQSALELGPSHCPNGRLGQDLGFGGFAFALKLPELLNTNLPTVRAKFGQTSSFPNGPQIWFPIGQ